MNDTVTFPDGVAFPFWDDAIEYTATFHVAQQHVAASDNNPGTTAKPFRTINAAARLVQPGERVVLGNFTATKSKAISTIPASPCASSAPAPPAGDRSWAEIGVRRLVGAVPFFPAGTATGNSKAQ